MYWKRETESHRFSICSYPLGGSYFPNSCRLARLKSGTGNSILLSCKGGGPLSPEPSPPAPRCTSSKLKLNCRAGTGMQLSGLPHNIYLPPPAMFWNQGICTFLMETIIPFFFPFTLLYIIMFSFFVYLKIYFTLKRLLLSSVRVLWKSMRINLFMFLY